MANGANIWLKSKLKGFGNLRTCDREEPTRNYLPTDALTNLPGNRLSDRLNYETSDRPAEPAYQLADTYRLATNRPTVPHEGGVKESRVEPK